MFIELHYVYLVKQKMNHVKSRINNNQFHSFICEVYHITYHRLQQAERLQAFNLIEDGIAICIHVLIVHAQLHSACTITFCLGGIWPPDKLVFLYLKDDRSTHWCLYDNVDAQAVILVASNYSQFSCLGMIITQKYYVCTEV